MLVSFYYLLEFGFPLGFELVREESSWRLVKEAPLSGFSFCAEVLICPTDTT
ncbi:hypothetical protein CARUB_v10015054mg [Capsella rubella]|uniref:Uncharacterized protein n=1 Tax=Capsella rubella TaxID=81985 RepID=R0I1P9_9BRAS|nr:hypothetical protein CARUB_v10015054mg [Capsella rubella]